ncbi:MAG: hypothetical protein U0736_22745 [Gemmataceae bacterium]
MRHLSRQTEAAPWPLQQGTPAGCDVRVLWASRDGHSDDEYEDGFAVDAEGGRAVVSDAPAAGIFTAGGPTC